jgi:hypothetical protein
MRTKIENRADARGRSTKNVGGFSRLATEMQMSPIYHSLTASALRVLHWAIFLNYNSSSIAGASGKPKFKLTNSEAKAKLDMNSTTFSRAKKELSEKGFMVWAKRGGLKGGL